jgi:hypothetical protein
LPLISALFGIPIGLVPLIILWLCLDQLVVDLINGKRPGLF